MFAAHTIIAASPWQLVVYAGLAIYIAAYIKWLIATCSMLHPPPRPKLGYCTYCLVGQSSSGMIRLLPVVQHILPELSPLKLFAQNQL